ncbi:dethiobiotin synthase [Methylomonas montana]|uniref:dethiobiotin synthase n=1 Tax=Methylomonas montana TaxID=3058963 RepID=UPI00265B6214|nr:dethiobiotin synthase [Methylomonas montana]WKJ88839.1 dethiobiotin synthase [Methylomonas montana]
MTVGIFITGTDTDVGKTWTTIALMRRFQQEGLTVAGMKPVAAGCEWREGVLKNPDALLMQQYASLPTRYELINPYAFEAAVSPHLACGDVEFNLEAILDASVQLRKQADVLLVEGAGGWYSPLSASLDNAGLALAMGLPVIMVVGIRLGCLNHARLTLRAIQQAGLRCAGWVAVQIDKTMPGFDGNVAFLHQTLDAPLLGVLPNLLVADFDYLAAKLDLPNWQNFDLHQDA